MTGSPTPGNSPRTSPAPSHRRCPGRHADRGERRPRHAPPPRRLAPHRFLGRRPSDRPRDVPSPALHARRFGRRTSGPAPGASWSSLASDRAC
ncbi:hypothetical protein LV779_08630 [Streptomyces thinghirensis]|nr:hypothetical protein [Streptomyces thinghirensis]